MSLIVETGEGVHGAESYVTVAYITNYWAARPQISFSTTWAAGTTNLQEGAARIAAQYLDAVFGPHYLGRRRGWVQGLLFPRTNADDDAGYPLPELPDCLKMANAELAGRAYSGALQDDVSLGEMIKSTTKRVEGAVSKSVEYFDYGYDGLRTSYGVVSDMLTPILDGSQPGANNKRWAWA